MRIVFTNAFKSHAPQQGGVALESVRSVPPVRQTIPMGEDFIRWLEPRFLVLRGWFPAPGVSFGVAFGFTIGVSLRAGAFVVAPERNATEILHELRENIASVFLPRPLVLVSEIPRSVSGKVLFAGGD